MSVRLVNSREQGLWGGVYVGMDFLLTTVLGRQRFLARTGYLVHLSWESGYLFPRGIGFFLEFHGIDLYARICYISLRNAWKRRKWVFRRHACIERAVDFSLHKVEGLCGAQKIDLLQHNEEIQDGGGGLQVDHFHCCVCHVSCLFVDRVRKCDTYARGPTPLPQLIDARNPHPFTSVKTIWVFSRSVMTGWMIIRSMLLLLPYTIHIPSAGPLPITLRL